MHWLDWAIVWAFCAISVLIGVWVSRRAGRSLDAYFVSNRRLGWWLAGTSIAATAFSSDTPLLITGMVRRRGIWGVWEVWALGISTMLTVFVFAKLWKRANVTTEVELVELRYSGKAAAFLRGFKALYWGLFYNCYIMGAWPVTGMTKVLQETTGFSREHAVIASVLLGAASRVLPLGEIGEALGSIAGPGGHGRTS
jgi:Na+/proline symporter